MVSSKHASDPLVTAFLTSPTELPAYLSNEVCLLLDIVHSLATEMLVTSCQITLPRIFLQMEARSSGSSRTLLAIGGAKVG